MLWRDASLEELPVRFRMNGEGRKGT
jgi:hypothetical protein